MSLRKLVSNKPSVDLHLSKRCVMCIPQVKVNNSVTPQFTEGPVNADFSGVLQVKLHQVHHTIFIVMLFAKHNLCIGAKTAGPLEGEPHHKMA